jgi:hypothetical protein
MCPFRYLVAHRVLVLFLFMSLLMHFVCNAQIIASQCKYLKALVLDGHIQLTDMDVEDICSRGRSLVYLSLRTCPRITVIVHSNASIAQMSPTPMYP